MCAHAELLHLLAEVQYHNTEETASSENGDVQDLQVQMEQCTGGAAGIGLIARLGFPGTGMSIWADINKCENLCQGQLHRCRWRQ